MEQSLLERCELFVRNKNHIKEAFPWDYTIMHCLCAMMYTQDGKTADARRIKECKQIMKKETGVFSPFRSNAFLALATMLSLSGQPEERFDRALNIYGDLKREGFHSSVFLALASFALASGREKSESDAAIGKAKRIYRLMKEEHPVLTGWEDYSFAMLLAMSGKGANDAVLEMERCFRILRKDFYSKNTVQSLCQILALGDGGAERKCAAALRIYEELKQKKCKLGQGYELAFLGVLAILGEDENKLVERVAQTEEYLAGQKGFGISIGRAQRVMYACALAAQDYLWKTDGVTARAVLADAATNVVIAVQAAIIAAVASSSAASASAGSSS